MDKITNFLCLSILLLGATALGMDYTNAKLDQELLNASRNGNLEGVQRLIKEGASVEAKNDYGWSPLLLAAKYGQDAMCKLLINKNASVEAKDNYGRTPLLLAANYGYKAVCRLLIENKASVQVKNNNGSTPLHWAAFESHEAVCRLLIENKASVEAKNNDGLTPLERAACNGREGICRLLIDIQVERARKNKAAIVIFLGIVRKRSRNLPCHMHYDVAKIIACQAFETVQRDKRSVVEQINELNKEKRTKWLAYIHQQMNLL
jgi:ankyrin repeat protein